MGRPRMKIVLTEEEFATLSMWVKAGKTEQEDVPSFR